MFMGKLQAWPSGQVIGNGLGPVVQIDDDPGDASMVGNGQRMINQRLAPGPDQRLWRAGGQPTQPLAEAGGKDHGGATGQGERVRSPASTSRPGGGKCSPTNADRRARAGWDRLAAR